MDTNPNRHSFRLQPIVLAVHLALAGAAMADPSTNALPTGGQVVSGQATIQQQGGNMDIQQGTPRAALDWQTFNIGAQAQVNFHQPDANSVALNRVAVGNASVIEGKLTANGQVFLVNPSGVLFGKGAQVDVGGLVATTMNISNKDFAAGNDRFSRDGSVGEVVNQGVIKARDGGYVALVAATVLNEGTLQANGGGTVALAAGDGATLQFNGGNLVNIQVDPATVKTLIENKQLIQAEGGRVLMTAVAASRLQGSVINNAGAVEANSITSEGGVIRLTGADEITNTGTLDASGKTAGGTVEIDSASTINQSGIVKADSSAGHGGTITLTAHDTIDNTGTLDASGDTAGGTVDMEAGTVGADSSGQQPSLVRQAGIVKADALSGKGGKIVLTGEHLQLDKDSLTTATGTSGGGEIYAGGGKHGSPLPLAGEGPGVRAKNAKSTRVEQGATLDASATDTGDGGTIVAWGDDASRAYGTFNAKGGPNGGNGGLVETSGHWLDVDGVKVDTTAALGKGGEWLLDPYNVTIDATTPSTGGGFDPTFTWVPTGTSRVNYLVISNALTAGNNVTINTENNLGTTENGDINVNRAITSASTPGTPTLTLNAGGGINVNSDITASAGQLNIKLVSGVNTATSPNKRSVILVNSGVFLKSGGGDINVTSGNAGVSTLGDIRVLGTIDSSGGKINIFSNVSDTGTSANIITGPQGIITSGGGDITLTASAGVNRTGGLVHEGRILSSGGDITFTTNVNSGGTADINTGTSSQIDSSGGSKGAIVMSANALNGGSADLNLLGSVKSGGHNITFNTLAGNADSTATITTGSTSIIDTGGGKLEMKSDISHASLSGAISLGGKFDSQGGDIILGGGSTVDGISGYADSTNITTSAGISTTDILLIDAKGGKIQMRGISSSNAVGGISFTGTSTTLQTSGTGTIELLGVNSNGTGLYFPIGSTTISTGTGNITLDGKSSNSGTPGINDNTDNFAPVDLKIQSSGGNISLIGRNTTASPNISDIEFKGTTNLQITSLAPTGSNGNISIAATGLGGINISSDTNSLIQTNSADVGQGGISLNAGLGDLVYVGTINAGTTINPNGTVNLRANNDISLGNASLNSGVITTHGQAILLSADNNNDSVGALTLNRTAVKSNGGNITLRGRNVSGDVPGSVDSGNASIILDALDGTVSYLGRLTSTSISDSAIILHNASGGTALGNIFAVNGTAVIGEGSDFNGGVIQNAGSIINVKNLTGHTGGSVELGNANTLTNLGAFTNVGAFLLNDLGGLNVTGPVNTGGGNGATASITTDSGALNVNAAVTGTGVTLRTTTSGAIDLAAAVNGGIVAGNTVTLDSAGGATETGGAITGAGLLLRSTTGAGGAFDLYTNASTHNTVGILAADTIGGALSFRNGTNLIIGTVGSTQGVNTHGQNLELDVGGNLSIAANLDTGLGGVLLGASGGISQTNTGLINAGLLTGSAGFAAILDKANTIANLGAFNVTSGKFTLNDAGGGLNITGTVTTNNTDVASITTDGGNLAVTTGSVEGAGVNLTTRTSGAINLSGGVIANLGNVALTSAGGATETTTGAISGAGLVLRGTGPFTLGNQAGNTIATLAANTSGGDITFSNSTNLSVGTITDAVGTTNGITSANQAVTLIAGGKLSIDKDLNAGTGAVSLATTAGDINGGGGRIISTGTGAGSGVTLNAAGGIGIGGTVLTGTSGTTGSLTPLVLTTNGSGIAGNITLTEANTLHTSRINITGGSSVGTGRTVTLASNSVNTLVIDANMGNADDALILPESGNIVSGGGRAIASALTLNAGLAIGAAGAPILTSASSINATSNNGAIWLSNDGIINVPKGLLGATGITGDLTLTASATGGLVDVDNAGTGTALLPSSKLIVSAGGVASASTVNLRNEFNDITLNGVVAGSSAGDAVIISTGTVFTNNVAGPNAITATGGRWLVFSNRPQDDTFGDLVSGNNALWNSTYPRTPPAGNPTGNRFMFAIQPTVTFTGGNLSKKYGQNLTAPVANAWTTSGFYNLKGAGTAFTQDAFTLTNPDNNVFTGTPNVTSAGSDPAANVINPDIADSRSPNYTIAVATGSLLSVNGNAILLADGLLTISQADIILAGVRAYDSTTVFAGATF
ncbi:MAG: filamentous hemagglutinin N-terminal domain-containing protein, partial [Candidatus Methylumidiphilus sp.]